MVALVMILVFREFPEANDGLTCVRAIHIRISWVSLEFSNLLKTLIFFVFIILSFDEFQIFKAFGWYLLLYPSAEVLGRVDHLDCDEFIRPLGVLDTVLEVGSLECHLVHVSVLKLVLQSLSHLSTIFEFLSLHVVDDIL